jgi:hypothetical protein
MMTTHMRQIETQYINIKYQYCIANKKMGKYLGGFIENIDVEMDDAPEYWCYAITPRLYNDFFDRMKDDMDLLKYDYGKF